MLQQSDQSASFQIRTTNSPLTYIILMVSVNVDGTGTTMERNAVGRGWIDGSDCRGGGNGGNNDVDRSSFVFA